MTKMKRMTMTLLSGLVMVLGLAAQPNLVVNLTTGVSGPISAPAMIAPGNNDDTWTVRLPNGTTTTPTVCAPLAAWANDPQCGSSWISPYVDASANPVDAPAGLYVYSTSFDIRQLGYCSPQRAEVNIRSMGGDNEIMGLIFNGHTYTLNPPQTSDFMPLIGSSTVSINLAHLINGATNTLSIVVGNPAVSQTGFNFCGDFTVHYNDPAFVLASAPYATYYTMLAIPVISPPAGTSYGWYLEELDASNVSQFLINNPGGPGASWWTPWLQFPGFDHTTTTYGPGNVNTLPASPTPGKFKYNTIYRISRGSWSANCTYSGASKIVTSVKSLDGEPQIYIYDTKSPDFSHLIQSTATASITDADLSETLHVFPNPSTGIFTLTLSNAAEGTVEVLDLLGKKLQTFTLNANTNTYQIDLSGYAKGMYVINITAGGKTQSKKVVLE